MEEGGGGIECSTSKTQNNAKREIEKKKKCLEILGKVLGKK